MRRIITLLGILTITSLACTLGSQSDTTPTQSQNDPTLVALHATATAIIANAKTPTTATPTLTPTVAVSQNNNNNTAGGGIQPNCSVRTDWPEYTVASGDTLSSIAERSGSTIDALAAANCMANPNSLTVGQKLRVPKLPTAPTTNSYNPPIIISANGDLWSWEESGASLKQLTMWGYNQQPVLAPGGKLVAYNSIASVAVDYLKTGGGGAGMLPSNIWILETATNNAYRIADQPANATYGTGNDNAIIRSTPSWSPDGTSIAWTELVFPGAVRRLAVYDFATKTSRIIVPTLPEPYQDGGYITVPVSWGPDGIALINGTFTPQTFEQTLYVYCPNGELLYKALIGPVNTQYIQHLLWVQEGTKPYAAYLVGDKWNMLDAVSGVTTPRAMNGVPELYQRGSMQGSFSVYVMTRFVNNSPTYEWFVADKGQTFRLDAFSAQPEYLNNPEAGRISIAPSADRVAFITDAVYIWRNGQITKVPGSERNAIDPSTKLVWGTNLWRVRGQ
jgi:LysM repeat protein